MSNIFVFAFVVILILVLVLWGISVLPFPVWPSRLLMFIAIMGAAYFIAQRAGLIN